MNVEMMLHKHQGGWRRLPSGDDVLRHMEWHLKPKEKQRLRHLFIYKNQLMYDIDAQVSMVLTSRRSESGTEMNAESDMLDKYKSMFDRWIDKYVDKVKERLILGVVDHRSFAKGDDLKDWSEKEIMLLMPEWWDDTAWEPLVGVVHDYVVNSVLSEFFKLTLTSKDAVTLDKVEDSAKSWDKMKTLLCAHKEGTVRRFLNPMGF